MTLRLFESAASSGTTLPACMSRRRLVDPGGSRRERICCLRDRAVVVLGFSTVRMMSGLEVEKRMTRSRGASVLIAMFASKRAFLSLPPSSEGIG